MSDRDRPTPEDALRRELAGVRDMDPTAMGGPHLTSNEIETIAAGKSLDDADRIDLHRITCQACSARIDRLRRLLNAPAPAAPIEDVENDDVELEADVEPRETPAPAIVRPPRAPWWQFAAQAAVLVLVAGGLYLNKRAAVNELTARVDDLQTGLTEAEQLAVVLSARERPGGTRTVVPPAVARGGAAEEKPLVIALEPGDKEIAIIHDLAAGANATAVDFELTRSGSVVWRQTASIAETTFSRTAIAVIPVEKLEPGEPYRFQFTDKAGATETKGGFPLQIAGPASDRLTTLRTTAQDLSRRLAETSSPPFEPQRSALWRARLKSAELLLDLARTALASGDGAEAQRYSTLASERIGSLEARK